MYHQPIRKVTFLFWNWYLFPKIDISTLKYHYITKRNGNPNFNEATYFQTLNKRQNFHGNNYYINFWCCQSINLGFLMLPRRALFPKYTKFWYTLNLNKFRYAVCFFFLMEWHTYVISNCVFSAKACTILPAFRVILPYLFFHHLK